MSDLQQWVDLGLRGRMLGFTYSYIPHAEVLHQGHGSAIDRKTYVRLMTRNRALLFAKSVPLSLLLRHSLRLIYGQLYFLVAYHRPAHALVALAKVAPERAARSLDEFATHEKWWVRMYAARAAAIVAPVLRRERSTILGDHGKPIRRVSAGVSLPSTTAAT